MPPARNPTANAGLRRSLDALGLPQRWRGRARFVVLATTFGDGAHFLAVWQAWRDDPERCSQLFYVAIESHPLEREPLDLAHGDSAHPQLAEALRFRWPLLTPDLHRLGFDEGNVQLLLAIGAVPAWLVELVVSVDAFWLGAAAPGDDPDPWSKGVCKALGRLAAPGATLAIPTADAHLREHLTSSGFELLSADVGDAGMNAVTRARFAPAFVPRRARPQAHAGDGKIEPHALIIGAGLAGCATAWALAEQGWRCTVLERHGRIASEASGNPAGLFHGIVNAQDGVHARFNRAAALAVHAAVRIAIDRHGVAGSTEGLLRLETVLDQQRMHVMLEQLGLPPGYVQALDAAQASLHAGIKLMHPAWFYPDGGWVHPAGLARSYLERASTRVQLRCDRAVQSLERTNAGWSARDAQGHAIVDARTVVLANAGGALALLNEPAWPIDMVRGQLTQLRASSATFGLPRLPVAGAGYLLPDIHGQIIFGATAQPGDRDASVRIADHVLNLAQLERLTGNRPPVEPMDLSGRTAWRWSSNDRLPVVGAVPDSNARVGARLDQPRLVPRLPGLFVFTALGSRGITWSALGAQVLASIITGAPVPLEAKLLDAIDPARFVSRRARRNAKA